MIRFGTDGWRGIISDSFTFENIRIISQGLADLIQNKKELPKKVAIGFDRRFLSKESAYETAKVMSANNVEVLIGEVFLPTPVLSWSAKYFDRLCGSVVITASHNPPYYNGFKFKERFGCSAFPETTKEIENFIINNSISEKRPKILDSFETGLKRGLIKFFNPMETYSAWLEKFIDGNSLRKFTGQVLIDPMNGSGSAHLATIIRKYGIDVYEIHADCDPLFRGVNPEPIEINLEETISICKKKKPTVVLVLDGDADRLGAIDENGNFFNSQQIYSLIAWHFLDRISRKEAVAKTVSTTHTIERLGEKYGVRVIQTPIGFKHIARKMIDGEVFLGGEESGGIGLAEHIPERDATLVSLLLLEIISHERKGISAIYDDICRMVGYAYFSRKDYIINDKIRDDINTTIQSTPPSSINGKKIKSFSNLDGFKFIFDDGTWVLVRTSGTEPVLRIYAEAQSREKSLSLIEKTRKILNF